MLTAVEETSRWTTQKIRAVRALMDETVTYVRASSPKTPHAVVELIFKQPYIRIATVVENKIVGREAASKYLRELAKLGVLAEEKTGRDKVFLHRKYLDVLFSDGHTFEPYPRAAEVGNSKRLRKAADRS
jgi:Fic family protein